MHPVEDSSTIGEDFNLDVLAGLLAEAHEGDEDSEYDYDTPFRMRRKNPPVPQQREIQRVLKFKEIFEQFNSVDELQKFIKEEYSNYKSN